MYYGLQTRSSRLAQEINISGPFIYDGIKHEHIYMKTHFAFLQHHKMQFGAIGKLLYAGIFQYISHRFYQLLKL
jgi:hypothetical protein